MARWGAWERGWRVNGGITGVPKNVESRERKKEKGGRAAHHKLRRLLGLSHPVLALALIGRLASPPVRPFSKVLLYV